MNIVLLIGFTCNIGFVVANGGSLSTEENFSKVHEIKQIVSIAMNKTYEKACDNLLFCHGEILDKIQKSGIYEDSKTFVDMPLRRNFTTALKTDIMRKQTKTELLKTVEKYFYKPGTELESVNISEPQGEPAFLNAIKDNEYREWTKHLCSIWKRLVRKIKPDVQLHADRYSLIYMKEAFVVPGGRFREMYYWDTYWSIEGLLICEMYETTRNILGNLIQVVEDIGFIPNGGRKYYKNRSQPPFLTLMVEKYWSVTKDDDFVKKHLQTLIKEHAFWMTHRVVNVTSSGKEYTLNRYNSLLGEARPESYREDIKLVEEAGKSRDKAAAMEMYSEIASAAESGWDFSSRWFKEAHQMTTIQTRNIIPVDLNTILCMVEFAIGKLAGDVLQDSKTAKRFTKKALERRKVIDDFFWNEEYGLWLDYDISTGALNKEFYLSSVFPLWAYTMNSSSWNNTRSKTSYKTLTKLGIFNYIGGIPTSLITSGQQWDFPNAWPPLQYVTVYGLKQVNINEKNDEAKVMAKSLAQKYLETAYLSWKSTGHMYEKYDVTKRSTPGHGGEYEVQEGFGWTNGVALSFLKEYGQELDAPKWKNGSLNGSPDHILFINTTIVIASFIHFLMNL